MNLPFRGFGIRTWMSPAGADSSFGPLPLRWTVRAGDCSLGFALILAVNSALRYSAGPH
jgi:hypothetical protein